MCMPFNINLEHAVEPGRVGWWVHGPPKLGEIIMLFITFGP